MRTTTILAAVLCGVTLTFTPATPQTGPDPDLPYGGPALSFPPSGPSATPCQSGDPCVLTGQNNQHRTSNNGNATNLGGMAGSGDYSNFNLAYVYELNNARLGLANFEPVTAQPLYITRVTTSGTGTRCDSTPCNLLVAASLSGTLYAFDTGTSPAASGSNGMGSANLVWNPSFFGDCPSGEVFDDSYYGFPGGQNLRYYGAVATPSIDIVSGYNPTVFVVSAECGSHPGH